MKKAFPHLEGAMVASEKKGVKLKVEAVAAELGRVKVPEKSKGATGTDSRDAVLRWLEKSAGTNDIIHEPPDYPISKIGERMNKLIDHLFDKIPNVTIILSTLIVNTHEGADERIQRIVNPQYEALVKRKQEKKARIVLADLHPVVKAEELVDGTHPNDEGYEKIAEAWLKAIAEAGRKGLLVEPQDLDDPNINKPPHVSNKIHSITAPFATSVLSWSTHRTAVNTTSRSYSVHPTARSTTSTAFGTVTPTTVSFNTPQVFCALSEGQAPVKVDSPSECYIPAKAAANNSQILPSAIPKSNAARFNKPFWCSWWL
ncbi:uncharacterized protein N0V89_010033 [Didymosphaeria variabile]|uniref:SGNH hydrolase-type esterase domain-containing protein n=1 Tax=Didymosphaeria variabile TaxID=1932322 RepID=A0A9W8XEW8_9PLEO|nr:uncharacterized protein N0V89_010033 [Didymosphaeria variabile]KAJ4348655.1 hypothetical protein N0V89_010033 [Didymosphaeria variabile]